MSSNSEKLNYGNRNNTNFNVNNNNSILTINKSEIISTKSRKTSSLSSSSSLTTTTESKSISVSKNAMPAKSNSIIIDDEYKSDIHNNCSNTRCNKNDSVVINNEFYDDGVFDRRGDKCDTNGNGGGVSNDGGVYSINLNKNKENPFNNNNNNNNNNNSIIKTIESPHENINISVNDDDDDDDDVVNNENTNCEKFFITKNLLLNDFWKNNKKHINDTNNADVIYENLCKNCGYGVFEAKGKYCNFCEFTLTGNLIDYSSYNKNVEKDKILLTDEIILQDTDERNNDAKNEKQQLHMNNIYENVCDRCGEIYNNNEECDVCKRNFLKIQQEYSIYYNENNNKNNKKTTEIINEEKYEKGKLIDEDEVVLEVENDEFEKEQLKIKKKSSKKTKNLFNGLFDTIKKVRSRNDNNNRNSSINISESNINNNTNKNKNNNSNNYEIKNNGNRTSNGFSISGSNSNSCSRSNSSKNNNKLKKLNIIHNVDGYDNVFRTQETFDLNYICELKRLQSSNSDQHIYGKLRNGKSDDQLLLSSSSSSSSAAAIFMNNSSDTNSNCSSIINNNNNNINNNNASNNDNNNQKFKMVTGCLKKLNENGNSKSDSTLNRLQSFVVRSSASVNDDGYSVKVNRTPFHQIRSLNRLRRQQQQQRQQQQRQRQPQQQSVHRQQKTDQLKFFIQEHVIEWMTSLRHQIHDYNNCLVNDSICSIKSIPSKNFSCCGLLNEIGSDILLSSLSSTSIITTTKKATKTEATPILTSQSYSSAFTLSAATDENEEEATLKSLFINSNDLDYTHMVDNFKRNLMEKQRFKRKAIYLKIDDRNNENNDILCSRSRSSTIDSLNSTLLHSSSSSYSNNNNNNNHHNLSNNSNSVNNRRYGIYENKDSDFVSDLLNAFDTFLKRDQSNQNDHHPEVLCDNKIIEFTNNNDIGININNESNEKISVPNSITEIVPFNNKLSNHNNDNDGVNDENVTETTIFVTDPLVFIKNFNIYDLIENLCLSCSLNRVLITYDRYLKEFLRAINTEQKFATCEFSQLFEIFHNLCIEQNSKFNQYNRLKKRRLKNEQNKIITDDRTLSTDLTLLTSQTEKAIELSLLPQSPVTVQLLPLPPPRISSHSYLKITAGADTEIQSKDEDDIYQPIWKFKTVGNPRESYVSENESEYYLYDTRSVCNDSSQLNAEDHGEWETDDEFMFSSTKIKERTATAASLSSDSECRSMTSTIISGSSKSLFGSVSVGGGSISGGSISGVHVNINPYYRNVYIIYSLTEPKIRAIFYDYDSIKSHIILGQSAKVHNVEKVVDIGRSGCVTRLSQRLLQQQQQRIRMKSKSPASSRKDDSKSYRNELIPDCVQAWKYMLLDTFYLDDEEDMYISEDEILKLKQIEQEKVNGSTLQRFKSVSSDNLLDIPQDKKSLSERFRNKLQRGVLKLSPKAKKGKPFPKRSDSTSLYLEDGVKPKYQIFGATLNDVEKDEINMNVPKFVVDCIEFIEMKDCIQSDGLYRASGNKLAIDDLKKKLSESFVYDCQFFKNQDVHTITGLLKLFFRELKTPLIPSDIYLKLPDNLIDANNIPIIRKVLQQIPNPSKGTLQYLVKHLTVVAHYSSENRMPASNLAIIWGPCILFSVSTNPFDIARMNTLTKVLIENYDEIFANNERLIN